MASITKGKSSKSSKVDDYLHTKQEKWTQDNVHLFLLPAILLSLIPSFLYWGVYDYRPDGFMSLIAYLIGLGGTVGCLLSAYTQYFIDCVHFLKCSLQAKKGEKRIKILEIQSKWWSLIVINSIFVILFLLANFYVFASSIPSTHFRYVLSTITPAAIAHVLVAANNKDSKTT